MMSSTTAIASTSNLTPSDTRSPSTASTPTANAMSVAIGIAQPGRGIATAGEQHEHDRRRDRPGHGRERRKRRGPPVAQLAVDELTLDLQSDDEEEHRHQAVVDPVLQVLVDAQHVHVRRPQ